MNVSARSYLTAGIATIGATAVALSPVIVTPPDIKVPAAEAHMKPAISHEMVELVAAAQQMAAKAAAAAGVAGPVTADAADPLANSPINQSVKNVYNWGEAWVRWGFDVAEWAVSWIPFVGWLAPQINILYNFGEKIVRSVVFNVDDWLFGPVRFFQGVANVATDSWNALVQLGRDEFNWAFGGLFPPLPPFPPFPTLAAAQTQQSTLAASTTDGISDAVRSATSWLTKDVAEPVLKAINGLQSGDTGFTKHLNEALAKHQGLLQALGIATEDDVAKVPLSAQAALQRAQGPAVDESSVDTDKTPVKPTEESSKDATGVLTNSPDHAGAKLDKDNPSSNDADDAGTTTPKPLKPRRPGYHRTMTGNDSSPQTATGTAASNTDQSTHDTHTTKKHQPKKRHARH